MPAVVVPDLIPRIKENDAAGEDKLRFWLTYHELLGSGIIEDERSSPPGTDPTEPVLYFIPSTPIASGLFTGQEQRMAFFFEDNYYFFIISGHHQFYNKATGLTERLTASDDLENTSSPASRGFELKLRKFIANNGAPVFGTTAFTNFSARRWRLPSSGDPSITYQGIRPKQFDVGNSIDILVTFLAGTTESSKNITLEATIHRIADSQSINSADTESKSVSFASSTNFTALNVYTLVITGTYSTLTINEKDLLVLEIKRLSNTYAGDIDILGARIVNLEPSELVT